MERFSKAYNIPFFHFVQPTITNELSKRLTTEEQLMLEAADKGLAPFLNNSYERILSKTVSQFYNLKNIFANQQENLFTDFCHLNDTGNTILATQIFSKVALQIKITH